jgi:hypothetical protein
MYGWMDEWMNGWMGVKPDLRHYLNAAQQDLL